MTSLATRLQKALAQKPDGSQAELARHCKTSAASVSNWFTGETKTLKAQSLVLAAEYLSVRPRWLLDGRGPMRLDPESESVVSSEPPTLAAALPTVLAKLPGLPDYTADKVLTALQAAIRLQAPLEQIEHDLLQWLGDPPHDVTSPGKQRRAA